MHRAFCSAVASLVLLRTPWAAADTDVDAGGTPAPPAASSQESALARDVEDVKVRGTRMDRRFPPPVDGTHVLAGKKITRVLIDERPPQASASHRQNLALVPGLLVSEVTNQAWASLSYRGLGEPHESWNLLFMRDGVPIVPDMYSYPAAYIQPPVESIARIDFVRGGASLLYGPQPGGALDFVSREPDEARRLKPKARGIAGSYGLYQFYGSIEGTVPSEEGKTRAAYLADVQHTTFDGMRPNADGTLTHGSAMARFDVGNGERITLRFDTFNADLGEPGGLTRARYDRDRTAASTPFDRIRIRRLAPEVRYERSLSSDTTFEARVFGAFVDRTSRRQASTSFGLDADPANTSVLQSQRFWTLGTQARLRRDWRLSGNTQTLAVGFQVFGSYAPVRVDKGLSAADDQGLGAPLVRSERRGHVVSLFGEHLFTFGRLRLVPGARLELIRQNVAESLDRGVGSPTDGRSAGAPNGVLGNGSSVEPVVLPGVGASYLFDIGLEPYVNVTRGYKPKLYNDAFTFQSGVNVASSFNPSYTLSSEMGVRGRPTSWLSCDASAFHITFDDQIGFFANDQGGATRTNVGSMRNRGVDLAAEVDPLGVLAIRGAGALTFYGNVSILDARLTSGPFEGTRPQYAPTHLVRTGLFYRFGQRAKLALLGTFLGRHSGADNAHPLFEIPAYQVWDVSAEIAVPKTSLAVFGGINNLGDERYFARVRPGGGGGIDPAFGRNVFVGVSGSL